MHDPCPTALAATSTSRHGQLPSCPEEKKGCNVRHYTFVIFIVDEVKEPLVETVMEG